MTRDGRHPPLDRVVSLYVAEGLAPPGQRGLLADSACDLARVVETWQNTPAPVVVRQGPRRRLRLRDLLEGMRFPSA